MQYRYDAAGQTIAEIDALGRVTKFIYDRVGRLVETIAPDSTPSDLDNPRTRTEYYTDGLVKATIDERGNRTEYRYDAAGRQTEVIYADSTPGTLSDNPRTKYVYDNAGQQTSVTDALNHTTSYVYDDLGRMTQTVFQDKTSVSNEYDSLGRRVAMVDQNGKRTEYRYDTLGRLTGVKDALNQWTEYGYNELGQLIYQEDANDHRTVYEYDKLGRRTATVLPLNQRSGMTYDEVGNLKTMTDFNGQIILYGYDEQNRLTQKSFQDGSKVSYTYTFNGLQDTITFRDSAGLVTSFYDYDYDGRDRLTQRTDVLGTGANQTSRSIGYGYDIASNLTSVTTASGTTRYTYDERNRLDIVRLNGALQADYDYDAVNRLTQTTFGNGTRETRSYDTLNRLQELSSKRLGDTVLLSKSVYTLDKVGNRQAVTETVNGQSRSIAYTYDDLYRLTDEGITDTTNGNRTAHYVYDPVGNRQSKTVNGVTTTSTYDNNDRLLNEKVNNVITAEYTYDNNGSTKTKTENGVTTTYTWNDEKRLIAATVGNTQQMEYGYNDSGIRVSSKVNGVETRYLLDEGSVANVWEEYAPNGTVQTAYVYGNDLITQTQANQTSYYLVDGLGSTRLLTDTQGQVLNSYGYEAFGQTVSQTGTADNKYQYAGEQFDVTLGDYYLRQRFYDTSSGRFGRVDAYEAAPGDLTNLNKYIYSRSNPVNYLDPTGFYSQGDGYAVERAVERLYRQERPSEAPFTRFSKQIGTSFNKLKISLSPLENLYPDILNLSGFKHPGPSSFTAPGTVGQILPLDAKGLFNEIKPLSYSGVSKGLAQMGVYSTALIPFGVYPDLWWHDPSNPAVLEDFQLPSSGRKAMIVNLGGIIFYTDDTSTRMKNAFATVSATTSASNLFGQLMPILLTPSNSSINELGRSKYLIESASNTISQANFALLASLVATAAVTARYGFA